MYQLLLIIIYLAFISLGLPDSLLGAAWPAMHQTLAVPLSYAAGISIPIAFCTVVSSLLSDRLLRRFGTGRVTVCSVGLTAIALWGFSCAPSYPVLLLFSLPFGLGAGSVDTALNNYVALHYESRHMNWLHCSWGIGATLGPAIMGLCLTQPQGWAGGYRTVALIQTALTLLFLISLPLWSRNAPQTDSSAAPVAKPPIPIRTLLRRPAVRRTLMLFLIYYLLEQASMLWGSSYVVAEKGLLEAQAASMLSLLFLCVTVGRLLSGFLSLRLSDGHLILLGLGVAIGGVLLLLVSRSVPACAIAFGLIGLGMAPIYPSLLHQTPTLFGNDVSQSMMGLQMACSYLGSMLSPLLMGLLVARINMVLYPPMLLLFLALLIWFTAMRNRDAAK